ncbi:branched-chain amino acid transport system II carrier protein [Halalkalibacterium ligniniphilum]|uniref:branched-chain amino acid transport system II carrier protein n=1 Tax=Halalkalibacterium ligniniphilum TaxID=1134413 RepID=UPI000347F12D|nr:branched-chain amino acid transport system II carrier protein [Halalkalibacterium ligniniphilum]
MRKKDTLFVGLMLFSMFFGAGNLIFPPFLGMNAGTSFFLAMAGFILTSVGLPLLVIVALSRVNGNAQTIGNRVHPLFGLIFTIIVYLSIGPFLAIPRNATVAYEMTFVSFFTSSPLMLLLFTILFFLLVYVVSLYPNKLANYMGKWITPILLLSIIVLCVVGLTKLRSSSILAPSSDYAEAPFLRGFVEGYSTMDALGALAFGIVILTTLKEKGVQEEKQLTKYMLKAGLISGAALAVVYTAIGLIGVKMNSYGPFENGSAILSTASNVIFGQSGTFLLGIIFLLACFTTCVGLTSACGHYFEKLIPKASYKTVVLAVTLVSFTLANFGLNTILTVSVPFLVMSYSLTIVLIVLALFHRSFHGSRYVYVCTILCTSFVALTDGLRTFGLEFGFIQNVMTKLPFSSLGLGWLLPAVFGFAIGLILSKFDNKLIHSQDLNQ